MVSRLVRAEERSLLNAAEQDGFDLFITADQELSYQQNLSGRKTSILVLSTNNWGLIKAHVVDITAAINAVAPGSLVFLDIRHARR